MRYGLQLAPLVFLSSISPAALAQIVPDNSLGTSVINNQTINGILSDQINGGVVKGSNLFHSFQEFNINTGRGVYFTNSPLINNIFTRVTGNNVSNINGTLGVLGSANLFFMNPNGIVFGTAASLDVKGSFLGTTANSIKFADGIEFAIASSTPASLLSVSVPVGLGFGSNPGAIKVNGIGHQLSVASLFSPITRPISNTGLRVRPEKTLALVGGEITLNSGILSAERGRVELASVGDSATVNLNASDQSLMLGNIDVTNGKEIRLSKQALIDTSGANAGSIQVQGRHITLTDSSAFIIQNRGTKNAGNIDVRSESLLITGYSPKTRIRSGLFTETLAPGSASNINVSTKNLTVGDGGTIFSRTYSAGISGSINLNATESIQVRDVSSLATDIFSTIDSVTFSTGNGGDMFISTPQLSILNSGLVSVSTFGKGSAGNLIVNADKVELIGKAPLAAASSAITTASRGAGNAGNLFVNTRTLNLTDAGRLSTASFSSGKAGDIIVNASEFVKVSGYSQQLPSQIRSDVNPPGQFFERLLQLPSVPTGNSGSITINTPNLKLNDTGRISVSNQGKGSAGTIRLNAQMLQLSNFGQVNAESKSGVGGDIILQSQDIRLRNNNNISTNAQGTGNGGNIFIDTTTLIALENSDITANSRDSFGGKVTINAQGIFGTQFREQPSLQSDITATSDLGASFSGQVNIITPDIKQQNNLNKQASNFVSTESLVASSCLANRNARSGKFVITSHGGLAETPNHSLEMSYSVAQIKPVFASNAVTKPIPSSLKVTWRGDTIEEAQKLIIKNGRVLLVTDSNTTNEISDFTCI
jgi:filamentous hemagglutinin family protein